LSDTKIFSAIVAAVLLIMLVASVLTAEPGYQQATGIIPQVVSCVPQHPPERHMDTKDWQPTLRVKVEPARDPGRVREYRVLGCTLYYYH
jgi:hypothetical protein